MIDIRASVEALGGFARKRELVALGAGDFDLTRAVRSGSVLRARNGWYSTRAETDTEFRAIRVGGRLTGASALDLEGAWVTRSTELHVSLPPNAARLRSQWNRRRRWSPARRYGVVPHWDDVATAGRGSRTQVALDDALVAYIHDAMFEDAVAVLDWALYSGRREMFELEEIIERLPLRLQGIRSWIDDRCESYPESIARTRLTLQGFRVVTQVRLRKTERIDLVVEDHVAIEVDGKEFHQDRFYADRDKDLGIALTNRQSLRLTVPIVRDQWPDVLTAIRLALEARRHQWRPRRSGLADARTHCRLVGTSARFTLAAGFS